MERWVCALSGLVAITACVSGGPVPEPRAAGASSASPSDLLLCARREMLRAGYTPGEIRFDNVEGRREGEVITARVTSDAASGRARLVVTARSTDPEATLSPYAPAANAASTVAARCTSGQRPRP